MEIRSQEAYLVCSVRRFLALLLILSAPSAFARHRSVSPGPQLAVPAADTIAAQALAEGVPGISIAVRKGDLTFTRAYGSFDREAHVATTVADVFSVGSITKQFTAAAILRLEEQGKLSISDKARKFVPELDSRFDAITIRHLLQHTSGIRDYVDDVIANVTVPKTQQEILAIFTRTGPLFPAGTNWDYSNSGYFLLGMIIERASARTYEQYLRENFLTPMGLLSTSYAGETAPPPRGYNVDSQGAVVQSPVVQPSLLYAAGGICATASDLVRWTVALSSSPAFVRMTSDRVRVDSDDEYGYGLGIDTLGGRTRISHSGGLPGFSAFLSTFPEEKITVAVLTNLGNPKNIEASDIANAIAQSLFTTRPE